MRSTPQLPRNEWVFLVVWYDGKDAELSFNGEIKDTDTGTGDIATTEDFQFGMHKEDRWYDGRISEIRIYNEFLNDDELQSVREGASAN